MVQAIPSKGKPQWPRTGSRKEFQKFVKKHAPKKGPERPKPTGPLPVRETDTFSIGCDRSEK